MSDWEPISLNELEAVILEEQWPDEILKFWTHIKVEPVKWVEESYGDVGNGFWVVAICGAKVVWYNDIEDGFNISSYHQFGTIDEYHCNQDNLKIAIHRLFQAVVFGKHIGAQRTSGKPLD